MFSVSITSDSILPPSHTIGDESSMILWYCSLFGKKFFLAFHINIVSRYSSTHNCSLYNTYNQNHEKVSSKNRKMAIAGYLACIPQSVSLSITAEKSLLLWLAQVLSFYVGSRLGRILKYKVKSVFTKAEEISWKNGVPCIWHFQKQSKIKTGWVQVHTDFIFATFLVVSMLHHKTKAVNSHKFTTIRLLSGLPLTRNIGKGTCCSFQTISTDSLTLAKIWSRPRPHHKTQNMKCFWQKGKIKLINSLNSEALLKDQKTCFLT